MSSRDTILKAVGLNKPSPSPLPSLDDLAAQAAGPFLADLPGYFAAVLTGIGGEVVAVADWSNIHEHIRQQYPASATHHRLVTTLSEVSLVAELLPPNVPDTGPHALADVELAIIGAHFGVAENGAVWLTDSLLAHRAMPFIAQRLAVVLRRGDLVPTMHAAYARIAAADYGFGVFVAGPSKTADIEQSLVLGAHGSRSMTVFLLP